MPDSSAPKRRFWAVTAAITGMSGIRAKPQSSMRIWRGFKRKGKERAEPLRNQCLRLFLMGGVESQRNCAII